EPVVRFTATVGIDHNVNTNGVAGSVRFLLEDPDPPETTENIVYYRSDVLRGKDGPTTIDVTLPRPVRRLLLKVDTTGDGPGYDQADWCDCVAVTAEGKEYPLTEAETGLTSLDVAIPFSFTCGGVSSRTLLPEWNFSTEIIGEGENAGCTSYQWTDPESGLVVTAIARQFSRFAAVDWVLTFRNTGSQKTAVIENVRALDVNCTVDAASVPSVLHTLVGDRCNEESWLPVREQIGPGTERKYTPVGGRPSNGAFPFWNLQRAPTEDTRPSEGVFIALGWSGQWTASFERPEGQPTDRVHVTAGMEKIHTVLYPGEEIRSPRILLMPWKCDRASAHALFRRLMMYEYAPEMPDGRPQRLRFIGQCFDRYYRKLDGWEKIDGQLAYAEKLAEAGCDTHWFDAAWFPKGFPTGVGNWFADTGSFPDGLRPLADRIHGLGMKFVLWFEPERVAPHTWLANEYPQYVAHIGDGKGDGLYRLDDPEARGFLTDHLSELIDEYGVDVYRNDFNIDPLLFWEAIDATAGEADGVPGDRVGITEIRYVEGLYQMWNELRRRHPGLWIDNCASGGRRIDLETLHISIPLWRSDTCCWPGHPQWDQTQTLGIAQYLPLYAVCSWEPDPYVTRSAAHAGIITQFSYLDDDYDPELAKAAIREAKVYQKFWYGDFYALTGAQTGNDQCTAWQLNRDDLGAGLVYIFRQEECPYIGVELTLRAIDP
ncbi:MAG: alpha-galactosidase, partial [Planctomycetia bacterium]|nr:alpha-galactosidase [Planctomycetia bacterium]